MAVNEDVLLQALAVLAIRVDDRLRGVRRDEVRLPNVEKVLPVCDLKNAK